MAKNSFYIENLKISLQSLGCITQGLAYLFPSKGPRELSHSFSSSWTCYSGFRGISLIFNTKISAMSPDRRVAVCLTHPVIETLSSSSLDIFNSYAEF